MSLSHSPLLVLAFQACEIAARATSITATTTVEIFLPPHVRQSNNLVGTILDFGPGYTSIRLTDTRGPTSSGSLIGGFCTSFSTQGDVTVQADTTQVRLAVECHQSSNYPWNTTSYILSESCGITGTTKAVCKAAKTIFPPDLASLSSWTTTTTLSSSELHFVQVPISAVDELYTPITTGTTPNSGSLAQPTAIAELFRVVIVPGAAALVAGAAVL